MSNKTGRILAVVVCLVMVLSVSATVPVSANGLQTVDLSTWTAESYPAVSGFSPGIWAVSVVPYNAVITTRSKKVRMLLMGVAPSVVLLIPSQANAEMMIWPQPC